MTAFNVVRFRVRPGEEEQFIDTHRRMKPEFKGFVGGALIKTGDRTFCMVGEWRNFQSIVDARPQMISLLDSVRGMLEDLGGGLGIRYRDETPVPVAEYAALLRELFDMGGAAPSRLAERLGGQPERRLLGRGHAISPARRARSA